MIHPSLNKLSDKAAEGCTGSQALYALGSCAFCPERGGCPGSPQHHA
jgi:hypothetical protein